MYKVYLLPRALFFPQMGLVANLLQAGDCECMLPKITVSDDSGSLLISSRVFVGHIEHFRNSFILIPKTLKISRTSLLFNKFKGKKKYLTGKTKE